MTLRTVAIPDPPAGVDWQTVVPGNYLYNVTGITATLDTGSPFGQLVDASGNRNNGFYTPNPPYPQAVAGLVAGDDATLWNSVPPQNPSASAVVFSQVQQWGSPFTFECWATLDPASAIGYTLFRVQGPAPTAQIDIGVNFDGLIIAEASYAFPLGLWESAPGAFSNDGAGHYLVVTYDGTKFTVTVDLTPIAPATNIGSGVGLTIGTELLFAGNPTSGAQDGFTLDEVAMYSGQLSSARQAAHFAAASSSFADYRAQVLADAPNAYYHFDEGNPTGRQVALSISDGIDVVEFLPPGFDDVPTPGPFAYSWQPNLPASAQTPDGTITTVAIPQLILPAGYTVGTNTIDIGPGDQWSDITLWWSDDVMNSLNPYNPYAYPPGATLVSPYLKVGP